jgi:hypothetical protein
LNREAKSVFPGGVDTQFVNGRIKTGPKKAILLGGVAVPHKQIFKTKPEKAVLPSGIAVQRKQVIKTGRRVPLFPGRIRFPA